MKIYSVYSQVEGYHADFYKLSDAKRAMKAHWTATGYITKVYSNGDWINCGEISLEHSNKTIIVNSKQKFKNY